MPGCSVEDTTDETMHSGEQPRADEGFCRYGLFNVAAPTLGRLT